MPAATETQWAGRVMKGASGACGYRMLTVHDAVRSVVERRWDIPRFQRAFSWSPQQVRDLADSLWRGYPMGLLLLWRAAEGAGSPLLIVDGQHRLTAMCILLGERPAWWNGARAAAWRELLPRYDVRFDLLAPGASPFRLGGPGRGDAAPPLSSLLAIDPDGADGRQQLQRIAHEACARATNKSFDEVYARLERLCRIAEQPLVASVAERPIDDVLEIFARLSGHGIRFRRLLLRTALRALKGMWVSQTVHG